MKPLNELGQNTRDLKYLSRLSTNQLFYANSGNPEDIGEYGVKRIIQSQEKKEDLKAFIDRNTYSEKQMHDHALNRVKDNVEGVSYAPDAEDNTY